MTNAAFSLKITYNEKFKTFKFPCDKYEVNIHNNADDYSILITANESFNEKVLCSVWNYISNIPNISKIEVLLDIDDNPSVTIYQDWLEFGIHRICSSLSELDTGIKAILFYRNSII